MSEIKTIALALPFSLGCVNCYLIKTEAGYVLIDTGSTNQRAVLEQELLKAGCRPGNLRLIILTHGDFDHTGNAAHLRRKFNAPLAMHPADFDRLCAVTCSRAGAATIRSSKPSFRCSSDLANQTGSRLISSWGKTLISPPTAWPLK